MNGKQSTDGPLRFMRAGVLILLTLVLGVPSLAVADDWPPAPPAQLTPDDTSGPTPPSITVGERSGGTWAVTFHYKPKGAPQRVTLAGTFNGWNNAATPMSAPSADSEWSVTIPLRAGKYLYKFVEDGRDWIQDPRNPEGEPDGHGAQNSVLRLGRLAQLTKSDAKLRDGKIDAGALVHQPDSPQYFQALQGGEALLRYETLAHDIQHVAVAVRGGETHEMYVVQQDDLHTLYETRVHAQHDQQHDIYKLDYTFVLTDGETRMSDPNTYSRSFTNKTVFATPEWARHAVWYQIMMDRFRNGNPNNDPDPVTPWTLDWFSPAPFEGKDGQTFYKHFVFTRLYGGDIDGLEEQLPYLKDLGVNAIYLNPVFKSPSHHKYDAINYLHIDDHFGTKGDYDEVVGQEDLLDPKTWQWTDSDKRFLQFIKTAHALGFHVIIDGVFNHVGTQHPAFQDVKKNGQKSRFADWFDVTSWKPFDYNGWAGYKELPVFKKSPDGLASESLKQHLFNLTRRWMDPNGDGDPSDGIDGWRLDVPNEIPMPFWVEWRKVVKGVNPEGYITGEIWDNAGMWLDGKHFDAVMNYPFARAVVSWVLDQDWKIKPSEFDRRLRELRLAYPLPATLVLQNLMDSHDTDRLVSMAANPDRAYDHANRVQDNGPDYNNDKPDATAYQKARLAVLIQMTYIGAPMVYYGDEAGMWGADDPTCRKPMLWKDLEPYDKPEENFVMEDHFAFYRAAIHLRRAHEALRTGFFQTLLNDDDQDVWAFLRWNQNEQLVVALNSSEKAANVTIPLPASAPGQWQGVFGFEGAVKAADNKLTLTVPPLSGVVLHAATPK